ncbi:glycoside hydrolase family 13 protein [Acholeplasma hippikon]|nr:alpha-glucosidase [Acholeplasma hippikon]
MEKNLTWWKKGVVYQIYPLSFKDTNNDGIGDIKGIISELNYLKDLGVDIIWLSPIYESPMDDNGYDISNYLAINRMFGTMEDVDELIYEVHQRGMRIIMDLVVNHTSDEYPWFIEARKDRKSKYRNYYIWKDEPTPEIHSIFSGSAWEYNEQTNDYYFHLFSKKQPDLNWQNPELRKEIYHIINTWLNKGIDGFRMDVIELIGKDIDTIRLGDGPYMETYLNEMYENCFKGRDIMTVGEMNGLSLERAEELTSRENMGLSMTFNFSHLSVDEEKGKGKWHIKKPDMFEMKNILIKNNEIFKKGGWNALFLSNHDQVRQVSRFGSEKMRTKSAQALFTMSLLQRGTPFIYQGEEIGMTGIRFINITDYKDIETINWYKEATVQGWSHEKIMATIYSKGRDNSRTPMQWNKEIYAGFSQYEPWLQVNPNYVEVNVLDEMNNFDSVYNYLKQMLKLRKTHRALIDGDFEAIYPEEKDTFIYKRSNEKENFLIISNLSDKQVTLDLEAFSKYKLMLSNDAIELSKQTMIKPYQAAIFMEEI